MESKSRIEPQMIYQHPLAYLLGLEGIALLRAFAGEYDRDFTIARFDEIRSLLDSVQELGDGVAVHPIPSTEAYASWALEHARKKVPAGEFHEADLQIW